MNKSLALRQITWGDFRESCTGDSGTAIDFGMAGIDKDQYSGSKWPGDMESSNLGASSAKVRSALQFWCELGSCDQLPTVRDFDFLKIPELIPHLVSVDVGPGPEDFRYRQIGTYMTDMSGRNATKSKLDEELYPDNREVMVRFHRHCWQTAEPVLVTSRVAFADRDWATLESLFLPLCSDQGEVTRIVCCADEVELRRELDLSNDRVVLDWRNSLNR